MILRLPKIGSREDVTNPQLVLTVGLPRSGKSTWARRFSQQHGAPLINPDSFRLAIFNQPFLASAEGFVWASVRAAVDALFLADHKLVVVDACHVTRKQRDSWRGSDRYQVVCMPFLTSYDECRRRARRDGREDLLPVIDKMEEQYEPLAADEPSWNPVPESGQPGDWYGGEKLKDCVMAVVADDKARLVSVDFGKTVTFLALPPDVARLLARTLDKAADEAEGKGGRSS